MTPDERKQRTLAIISETLKMLGCELVVQYQTEQLGSVLQTRAQIIVRTLPDWTPQNNTGAEISSTIVDSEATSRQD